MGAKNKTVHFNIMDLLIILVVLAAGALLLYVFVFSAKGETSTPDTRKIRYVVEIKNIRDEFIDNVTVGENLTDASKLYPLGTIVAYESMPSTYTGTNKMDGTITVGDYPEHSNMYITVEADAVISPQAYNVNGFELSVGTVIYVKLPNFTGTGYCIKLEEIE